MDAKQDYLSQVNATYRISVNTFELNSIMTALSSYRGLDDGANDFPYYFEVLEHRARMLLCYNLYRRLFGKTLSGKLNITLTLNHTEVWVLQDALQEVANHTGDNIVRAIFGRLHRETCGTHDMITR